MTRGPDTVVIAGADGHLEGLEICGFHGAIDPAATPARREPIFMDGKRRVVEVLSLVEGDGGARHAVVERSRPLAKNAHLPGVVTKLEPLPARLGDIVVILGQRDMVALEPGQLPVRRAAVGELNIVVCSMEETLTLCETIAAKAIGAIREAMAKRDSKTLEQSAWWLSRATTEPAKLALAVVALGAAKSPHAELLRQEAFRGHEPSAVDRWTAEALRSIRRRPELAARARVRQSQYSSHGDQDRFAA